MLCCQAREATTPSWSCNNLTSERREKLSSKIYLISNHPWDLSTCLQRTPPPFTVYPTLITARLNTGTSHANKKGQTYPANAYANQLSSTRAPLISFEHKRQDHIRYYHPNSREAQDTKGVHVALQPPNCSATEDRIPRLELDASIARRLRNCSQQKLRTPRLVTRGFVCPACPPTLAQRLLSCAIDKNPNAPLSLKSRIRSAV